MSESDVGDRTMPPTERRRREMRQRGSVARSSQLTSALILVLAAGFFWCITPVKMDPLQSYFQDGVTKVQLTQFTVSSATNLIGSHAIMAASVIAPFGLLILIGGAAANLVQFGWLWAPSQLMPRFRGRAQGSGSRLIDALECLLRFAVLGGVTWQYLSVHQWQLYSLSQAEPPVMLAQFIGMVAELCFQLSACLVLLGLLDYGYRFWRHEQSLMMTIEEVRQEQREESTNPHVRKQQTKIGRQRVSTTELSGIEPLSSARS